LGFFKYQGLNGDSEAWVCLGDTSRTSPPMHWVKWEHIVMDLLCQSPYHINMYKYLLQVENFSRHLERGVLERVKEMAKKDDEPHVNNCVEEKAPKESEGKSKKSKKTKKYNHCLMVFSSFVQ